MRSPIVTVKCVGCSNIRDIKPGEIAKNDQPICERCGMPLIPVKVKLGEHARRISRLRR